VRCAFLLFTAAAAGAATWTIPRGSGPLAIDGSLEDAPWRQARVLPLAAADFGAPFPEGGETRILIHGHSLCFSARLPEPDRVVAFSTGRDPAWGREDLISWRFSIRPPNGRSQTIVVSVNPLGGLRVESTVPADLPGAAGHAAAAASVTERDWRVEAAIPLQLVAEIGFLAVERLRVPRPQAPELRWHWPAVNDRADFALTARTEQPTGRLSLQALPPRLARPAVAPPAAGFAALDARVWPDRDMLRRHLQRRMAEQAEREKRAWQQVRSRADWERFRDPRLAALRASLAPLPPRTPLRAAVTRRADFGDGFVIENLVYESRPHLLVTANLYLPARISARIPALVLVHSHHAPKTQAELQDLGMTWARQGIAVLVMDQLGAGERLQSNPWPRESYYSRYALGMQLHLAGDSLMQWMVWDLLRGIDLLLERRYIDPERIVLLGAVAGGGDPAAVAAALDDRIAAVIPFNFGEAGPEEHYLEGPRPYDFDTAFPGWGSWETTRNLWRSAADQFFPWFICASVAPRRFVYAFEIAWPQGVERQPAWARYKQVFQFYGRGDHLDAVDGFGPFPGPGECTNVGTFLRKRLYPILKRWFDFPAPAQEYRNLRPEAELMCLTPPLAAERTPQPASEIALEMARARLKAAHWRRRASPEDRRRELRAALTAKLGDIEPAPPSLARSRWSRLGSGFQAEGVTLETEPGITVPLLLLKPANALARLPAVLAFAQGGKQRFLSARGAELNTLLEAGITVCLTDVRGTGETAPDAGRGPGAMGLAATDLMLGNTLLGAQLRDARSVFGYLASRADIHPQRIAVWGDSFAPANPERILPYESLHRRLGPHPLHQAEPLGALLALLTALYEDRACAMAVRGGLVSFLSVLEDRYCYVPLDVIVPGILQAGDIPDLTAALAPRPVRLVGLVDGRNRPVQGAAREPASLASWLVRQLRP